MWRRRHQGRSAALVAPADPLIIALTEPVTRATADAVVAQVQRAVAGTRVVLDLTGIPAFDSDGVAAVSGLQESLGPDRLTVVGLRQAAARLVGGGDDASIETLRPDAGTSWVVRRLRAIAVVQHSDDVAGRSAAGMEPAIETALQADVGIVVIDLRGVAVDTDGIQMIAFASSAAALRGQELLVVNIDKETADRLRAAGLSATTYVAPEPLPGL